MKARYLAFFSYIGTGFRSSEKVWLKTGKNYPDPESIQGMLELALLKLRPLQYPNLTLSSRTDGGVHALNASAHFDLERFGTKLYDTEHIAYECNKTFYKNNCGIFMKRCLRVSDDFSARYNAKSRTYLYRMAWLKKDVKLPEHCTLACYIPVEEWKRCFFMRAPEFDIERMREGAKCFVGLHDFTTFKKFDKALQHKHNRRVLHSIDIKPGRPLVTSYTGRVEGLFDYWDITIHGRAFVHNQIRRMLGALVSVAAGKIEPKDIQLMLQIPSKNSWHPFINTLPPDGLYLCNVEYDPEDLIYKECIATDNDKECIATYNDKERTATDNDKERTTTDNDKERTTTDNDKERTTTDNDKERTTTDNDKERTAIDNDKESIATDNDKERTAIDNDKESIATDNDKQLQQAV